MKKRGAGKVLLAEDLSSVSESTGDSQPPVPSRAVILSLPNAATLNTVPRAVVTPTRK